MAGTAWSGFGSDGRLNTENLNVHQESPENRWTLLSGHHGDGNLEASPQRLILASQGEEQIWSESSCLGNDWMPVHVFSANSIQFALGSSESGSLFIQTWDASQNTGFSCSELSSEVEFGEEPVAANVLISEKIAVATRGMPVNNNSNYCTFLHVFNQNKNNNVSIEPKAVLKNCDNLSEKLTEDGHLNPDVFDLCGRPVKDVFFASHHTASYVSDFELNKVHIVAFRHTGIVCPFVVLN